MLRKNLSTDVGLVHGASGTITGFYWSQGNSSTAQPDGIEVNFDNADVGKGQIHGNGVLSQAPLLFTP